MSFSRGADGSLHQPAPVNAGRPGAGLRPQPAEIALVVAVAALVVAACWPAISVSFGYSGTATGLARTTPGGPPAAPAPVSPAVRPASGPTPPGGTRFSPEPVSLNAPVVIHATGAELSWPPYANVTAYPAYDLAAYEVHRGTRPGFTPSAATLVATVSARRTSFTDTTAVPGRGPQDYFYLVAVRTRSGQLIASPARFVRLPGPGQTELVLPADAAATLDSGYPDLVIDPSGNTITVSPDFPGHGVERAIVEFRPLTAVPAGAVVADARLSVWCNDSDGSPLAVYALTRAFNGSQATWNKAANGVAWARPGGDYLPPAGGPLPLDTANPAWCEFDATAIVRGWAGSHAAGHGVLLREASEAPSAGRGSFFAAGTSSPDHCPRLIVTYVPGA